MLVYIIINYMSHLNIVLPNINDDRRILTGHLEHLPKAKSSVVRVFLSSTFAGTYIKYCWQHMYKTYLKIYV